MRAQGFAARTLWLIILAAALRAEQAPDPPWKRKPVAQWDEADARQVLADSPWVKYVTPQWLRDMSPSARRESGNWDEGIGRGVGLEGVLGGERGAEAIARAHEKPGVAPVAVRWESALPVRIAEEKTKAPGVPAVDGLDYAIAIYSIMVPDRRNLARDLKIAAVLKRAGEKDMRPSLVRILPQAGGRATIVYLFPGRLEIGTKNAWVQFNAQVGRLAVSQVFYTADMRLNGELELLMPVRRQ